MFNLASIRKRGKYWQAKVYYYDENHKRHAKSLSGFTTKREASAWATDMQNGLNN